MKACSKCGAEKPLSEFHKSRNGLRADCKECRRSANRAWHAANPEKASASNRAWRVANRERVREYGRAWREANAEHVRESGRAWRETNKDRIAANKREYHAANRQQRRDANIRRRYGITPEEYDALEAAQAGRCGICGAATEQRLAVDHDHTTGAIRGLLCARCNVGLGHFGDDPAVLLAAAAYIQQHLAGAEAPGTKEDSA